MSARVNKVVRSHPNGAGSVVAEGYKYATPSGVKMTLVVLFGCGSAALRLCGIPSAKSADRVSALQKCYIKLILGGFLCTVPLAAMR